MTPTMRLHTAFERLEAEHGENIPVGLAFAESLKAIREARKKAYEKAARIAANPYGDEVRAVAGDEPKAVGHKIESALRALTDSIRE